MATLYISHYMMFSEAEAMDEDHDMIENWEAFAQPQFTKISTDRDEARRYAVAAVELELAECDEIPADQITWQGDECFVDGEKVAVIAVTQETI